jgi:acyl-CoA synthetase (AMP-forming)/AMP-acid ligase II
MIDGPSGRTLTYGELTTAIKAFAAGLAARGFKKGDVLCVYMPNLPEYAIAIHGAASIGAVCTTANPMYTANEVARQLEHSGARAILTIPQFLDNAAEAAEAAGVADVFVVGEAPKDTGAEPFAALLGDPADAPDVEIDPGEDVAVMPYSSGTTGLPKGVMLTHRNLVANTVQSGAALGAQGPMSEDVVIAVLPFFHIYGMQLLMNLSLRRGSTLVTMPRFDLEQFLDLIEEHEVSGVYLVPPIALALVKHPAVEGRDLSSIRIVTSGAAPLGAELSDKLAERVGADVIQGYGLTETSPVTHTMVPGSRKPGSIGPPVPGTECRLVDPESGEDVDDGERGELWIRGPQVMKGYLDNEEATAATIDADGWLHTGDVAVRDADNHFKIVDRLKELIKYKGYQVAPAELEALILNHPEIADVAVIGVPDEEAGELPKAYVVAAGDDLDTEALMAWIAEQVSPQKKIRIVELIDAIPKSPSGKILRRVLKDREATAPT